MGLQSSVNIDLGFGVVGDVVLDGSMRSQPAILSSGSATNNVVGRAFTVSSGGASSGDAVTAAAGGTGVFAGILANSKNYVSQGTSAGGTLAATLALPNNSVGELVTNTAGIVITLSGSASVGYKVEFVQSTGVLNAIASGASATAGSTIIVGSRIERYDVSSGLAIMSLNNTMA